MKHIKLFGLILFLVVVLGIAVYFGRSIPGLLSRASSCPAQNVSTLQATPNSAVIAWETENDTQGRVEYGTSATNLAFSAPEGVSGTNHNVPLTLLTPKTTYYYLINIGNTRCDSSGQACDTDCVPWSFTTASVAGQNDADPTNGAANGGGTTPPAGNGVEPTSSLSAFCKQVQVNIGKNKQDPTSWSQFSKYDMDENGILNGKDVISCIRSGK